MHAEAQRLFRDMLVGGHADEFDHLLNSTLKTEWGFMPRIPAQPEDMEFFVSFAPSEAVQDGHFDRERQLQKLSNAQLRSLLDAALLSYSREFSKLDILLFGEMLTRLTALDRTLTQSGGSLLLAGRVGAGRRALVTLVAYLLKMDLITPKITRNYSTKHFKQDLKTVVENTGRDGKPTVLLLEDHHMLEDAFYELVNALLSTGEIPGLFKNEEMDAMLNPLKESAGQEGWRGNVYSYFVKRVKANLHVVLVMDSSRWDFSQRCESNPAFFSCCTLVWMDSWHADSMLEVPRLLLHSSVGSQLNGGSGSGSGSSSGNGIKADELYSYARQVHKECLGRGATPRHFRNLLDNCGLLYQRKLEIIHKQETRLSSGLSKLKEATSLVDELKVKAHAQVQQLQLKKKEADQALKEIQANMAKASRQKTDVEALKDRLSVEETKLAQRKRAIDAELSSIEPVLEAARSAVGQIKPESLSEIRALRAPPDTIRDILQGVLALMGIYDTSWVSMRSFLAKRGVTDDIIHFDARRVSPDVRQKVEQLLKEHESSFQPEAAKRANVAAAPLAKWVLANLQYAAVVEKIGPLEAESMQLRQDMQSSQEKLLQLTKDLEEIDRTVEELTKKYAQCTAEGALLEAEYKKSQEVIASAEGLISKLDGERVRWAEQTKAIHERIASLPLKALLASAFIVYLGNATEDDRENMVSKWCTALNIVKVGFDFLAFMSTESEQLMWKAEGLPSDRLSLENAVILLNSSQSPLLVDPGLRATEWIKVNQKEKRFEVVNQQDSNFVTSLELALRFGKTLLVQEADVIEPILFPILRKDLVAQGPRFCVLVGDKLVDYNDDFRLILSTRNGSLDLPPNAAAVITTVNFTTTRAGLANQLLARTIQHEKPQLEERKMELLRKEDDLKLQLADMEEELLAALAASQGNILENKPLLNSLTEIKAKSTVVAEALSESIRLQTSLDTERDVYLPLAQHGSRLFFVIGELARINSMYQYSLSSFLDIYDRTMHDPSLRADDQTTRIRLLSVLLVQRAYEQICQSLFRGDRLTFAMMLAQGMFSQQCEPSEWEHFTGQLPLDAGRRESIDKVPSWVPSERVSQFSLLCQRFPEAANALQLRSSDVWSLWAVHPHCENEFPSAVQRHLRTFQQLLLIQAVRPDRLLSAMTRFCCTILSLKDLSPPSLNMKQLYESWTKAAIPTLIIISPGTDPSQELQEIANDVVGQDRFHQVS